MKVAIFGTGIVGRTLAAKLDSLGHKVLMGTRDVQHTLSRDDKDAYGSSPFKVWHVDYPTITLKTFAEAAAEGEMLFNCTGGMASIAALKLAGAENLKGKVLVDVANPLDFSQGMPPSLNPHQYRLAGRADPARLSRCTRGENPEHDERAHHGDPHHREGATQRICMRKRRSGQRLRKGPTKILWLAGRPDTGPGRHNGGPGHRDATACMAAPVGHPGHSRL